MSAYSSIVPDTSGAVVNRGGRVTSADIPGFTISWVGEKALRARLLQLSQSVQGAVMRPIVQEAASKVQALARQLAPSLTGVLRAGIVVRLLKWGAGYCQHIVTLDPAAYYGKFIEYGLGEMREGGLSTLTKKRRANAANSLRIKRQIDILKGKSDISTGRINERLGKREAKRQKILDAGRKLQGMHQPNMAPHPFLRPAVRFYRTSVRAWMVQQIWKELERWSAPEGKAA